MLSNSQGVREISLELTDKCPLNCRHCSTSATPFQGNALDPKIVNSVLIEAKKMGAECLTLSGGEPLCYESLPSVLSLAQGLGYRVSLYLAGVHLTANNELTPIPNRFFNILQNYNIDRIIFSIHSSNSEIHDYITQKQGSFYVTLESIKRAVDLSFSVEIHTVPMTVNYKQIPAILELADSLGVELVSLLRLVPQGHCVDNLHLLMGTKEYSEFQNIVNVLRRQKKNIRTGAPFKCLFFEKAASCSAGVDKVLISPDGSLHPCEAFKSDITTSNINSSSLQEIWETDKRLNELRSISPSDVSWCRNCQFLQTCQGGCPGERFQNNGNLRTGPDPACSC